MKSNLSLWKHYIFFYKTNLGVTAEADGMQLVKKYIKSGL